MTTSRSSLATDAAIGLEDSLFRRRLRMVWFLAWLLLCSLRSVGLNAEVVIYDNLEEGPFGSLSPLSTTSVGAQQFFTTDVDNVASVALSLRRVRTPVGEVAVQIWDDNGGVPGEVIGTLGSFDVATLPTTADFFEFDDPVHDLIPNSSYFLVLALPDTFQGGNTYAHGMVNSEGTNGASKMIFRDPGRGIDDWTIIADFIPPGCCGPADYLQMLIQSDPIAQVVGDFDGDGILTASDIDTLTAAIIDGPFETRFDLNGDGSVDADDSLFWITDLKETFFGDTDFNGQVNAGDLNTLALNWRAADVTSWAQGDFNGDGNVDASDLNSLALNWRSGVIQAASAAVVPEPSSISLLMLGGFALLRSFRRRNR